jgi:hypothetical protein
MSSSSRYTVRASPFFVSPGSNEMAMKMTGIKFPSRDFLKKKEGEVSGKKEFLELKRAGLAFRSIK